MRTSLVIDAPTTIEIHRIAGEDRASFYRSCNRLLRLGIAARILLDLHWPADVIPSKGQPFHVGVDRRERRDL